MRSIRLKNFRSFEDTDRIELRPITILVGANSSGKSSFLRFFPLVRQTVEAATQSPLVWYSDKGYVDFGDFSQAVRRGAKPSEMNIEFELEFDAQVSRWRPRTRIFSTVAVALIEDEAERRTQVRSCVVSRDEKSAQLSMFDLIGPQNFVIDVDTFGFKGLVPRRLADGSYQRVRDGGPATPQPLIDLLQGVESCQDRFARGIRYIGPARVTPQRDYRVQELLVHEITPQGENLPMFLRSLRRAAAGEFSNFVFEHLGFHVRVVPAGAQLSIVIEDAAGKKFNLIDMGYGFSQVLPILAQGWAATVRLRGNERFQRASMLALEQPELHLHPRLQARLADMMVGVIDASRSLSNNEEAVRFLVETHSEALISRLGEMIEAGAVSVDDVSILLFEKSDKTGTTKIRRSHFTDDGMLKNWPIGFFAP